MGNISKVGGSLAKGAGINAILLALSKLSLPVAVIKAVLLDKVIDLVIDQIISSPAEPKLELRRKELFSGYGSRLLALDPGCQNLQLNCLTYPNGVEKRFSGTGDIPGIPATTGQYDQARSLNLPNKIQNFGAVAFGSIPSWVEPSNLAGVPPTKITGSPYLQEETPWYWVSQGFAVPEVSKGELANIALVYARPFVQYSVAELYPLADTPPSAAGNGNAPPDPYILLLPDLDFLDPDLFTGGGV
jgi:hypothetical protein